MKKSFSRKNILKEASVLLIAVFMVLSTVVVTGNKINMSDTDITWHVTGSNVGDVGISEGSSAIFEEDFTGVATGAIPAGWTRTDTHWGATQSNHAGGVSAEMRLSGTPGFSGTCRLITPAIDTTGVTTSINLTFKNYLDHHLFNGYNLRVELSPDGGSTWIAFYSIIPTQNMGPETVTISIGPAYLGGIFYLAWTYIGNSSGINYWYIDDISLSSGGVNNPPNTPSKLNGPTSGVPDIEYTYTTSTTDPDGDTVRYGLEGTQDNTVDFWTVYYNSGVTCEIEITFVEVGTYYFRVLAEDEHGAQSGFSQTLTVVISEGNPPVEIRGTTTINYMGEQITGNTVVLEYPNEGIIKTTFDADLGPLEDWIWPCHRISMWSIYGPIFVGVDEDYPGIYNLFEISGGNIDAYQHIVEKRNGEKVGEIVEYATIRADGDGSFTANADVTIWDVVHIPTWKDWCKEIEILIDEVAPGCIKATFTVNRPLVDGSFLTGIVTRYYNHTTDNRMPSPEKFIFRLDELNVTQNMMSYQAYGRYEPLDNPPDEIQGTTAINFMGEQITGSTVVIEYPDEGIIRTTYEGNLGSLWPWIWPCHRISMWSIYGPIFVGVDEDYPGIYNLFEISGGNIDAYQHIVEFRNGEKVGEIIEYATIRAKGDGSFTANADVTIRDVVNIPPWIDWCPEIPIWLREVEPGCIEATFTVNRPLEDGSYLTGIVTRYYNHTTNNRMPSPEKFIFRLDELTVTQNEMSYEAYGRYEPGSNPPDEPSVSYNKKTDELVIRATDPDDDDIRYGISWNNDQNVDAWTDYYPSGESARMDCEGKEGTVGVIAQDANGAYSSWVSVKSKEKSVEYQIFDLLLDRLFYRFPFFEKILNQYYYN